MNKNLGQFIVQSNQEVAMGVAPLADVAPWEAMAAGRRGGHDDLLGVERRVEKEKGWGGDGRCWRGSCQLAAVTAKRT
jgi:hypothetical protein